MGSLVAILRKDGGDATYEALNMLRMTAHGVFDFFSIASWKGSIASRSLSSIEGNISPSSIVLGHKFVKTLPNDALQSMVDGGLALLFEGRLYSDLNISDIESALKEVRENPERGAARLLWKRDGAFVFILSTKDLLIIGRDSVGLRPLYYGEDEKVCAVASERKAFIPLGMSDVKPFPPGHLAYVNAEGFKFRCIRTVTQPEISSLAMDEAVAMLRRYLFEAVKTCTSDLKSIAVAFSGGLDSSVLARVCSLLWKEVELFMVTLEGAEDVEKAKNIANELGLPINVRVYGVEDIAERLSEVPWITESPSPLDNAVAIPILWVA
ncbi:MAG: asparagine synthase-related protein, partial [Candidatus Bathyarchaeia archaeon]